MISVLIFLLGIIILDCHCHTYVLTVFDDLPKYSSTHLRLYLNSTPKFTAIRNRSQFCKYLLTARIFEIHEENTTRTRGPVNLVYHIIDPDHWTLLTSRFNDECRQRRFPILGMETGIQLWSQRCLNHDSTFTWIGTYDSQDGTGLLYTTTDDHNYTIFAVIDRAAKMHPLQAAPLSTDFRNSIEHEEPLCRLQKSSKFRICSVCAQALHKSKRYEIPTFRQKIVNQRNVTEYADPYSNYQYRNSTDDCPTITIAIDGEETVDVRALFCNMSIKHHRYHLYLKRRKPNSRDKRSKYNIFVVEKNPLSDENQLMGIIPMPQLQTIFFTDFHLSQ